MPERRSPLGLSQTSPMESDAQRAEAAFAGRERHPRLRRSRPKQGAHGGDPVSPVLLAFPKRRQWNATLDARRPALPAGSADPRLRRSQHKEGAHGGNPVSPMSGNPVSPMGQ